MNCGSFFSTSFIFFLTFVPTFFGSSLILSAQNKQPILPEKGVCAHRGAQASHPENTISAFKEAVRLGAQMVEFDVRMTKDEKLVVIHDATIDRTTNGTGLVENLTWNEINKFDAGIWKSEAFKGERVPLFDEVLEVFPINIWLNIHLKGNEKLGAAVAKIVLDKNRLHQVIIACNDASAKGVKQINGEIMICNMERTNTRKNYIAKTIKGKFAAIQLLAKRDDLNFVNDINKLKRNGIKINYFYSDNPEEGINLFNKGIDFVLTDNLENMLMAAETIGIKPSKQPVATK